jgi:predicted nucleotidyltransferase
VNQGALPTGLSEATLQQLRAVLAAHPAVESATLFGSRALGRHKPGSDIDLALQGAALDERELGRIADEIDDLLLPYTLDLCRLASIDNPDLLAHIRTAGQTLYIRNA